jgi:uncharacterized damage-inducible protein DinB
MEKEIVNSLKRGLHGTWSHPDPMQAVDGVDYVTAGKRVDGHTFTLWQLSNHILSWAWQIVRRLQDKMPPPSDEENNFYPVEDGPSSAEQWNAHRNELKQMGKEVIELLTELDPKKKFGEWDNITALDNLMILLTHNSYHTVQIVALRKALGVWKTS